MKTQPKRVCIYPKDIERITGLTYRQCNRIINKIKSEYNKPKNGFVSVDEFCQFTGLKYSDIEQHL
ncbi:hypothetical protein ACSLMH_03290 [Flavobacterium columnare]|uniref:hypothetical protein n=1 Tax=Flavobacterium columnare TaxID=996 RepID=UPI0040347C14